MTRGQGWGVAYPELPPGPQAQVPQSTIQDTLVYIPHRSWL